MATVQIARQFIPERQQATEVISISDDEDDIVITGHNPGRSQTTGPPGPSNVNGAIYILDSDDEQSAPSTSRAHTGASKGFLTPLEANVGRLSVHRLRRNRLVSPPPRTAHAQPIPPVPPIPRHLRGHRHAHSFNLPPAIVPNPHPLPFEDQLDQSRHRNGTPPVLPPRASARSHHHPAMGLGGALIALNRQNALEEDNLRRQREQGARRGLPSWTRAATGFLQDVYRGLQGLPPVLEEEWGLWRDHEDLVAVLDPEHRLRTMKEQETWKPSYTHPPKPQPGFSFDFAPGQSETNTTPSATSGSGTSTPRTIIVLDDDDDSSAHASVAQAPVKTREFQVETSSELICANCQDPLVLSSGTDVKTEEEQKNLRVWGLRCGHMLDGKCIKRLMRPKPPLTDDSSIPDGSVVAIADEHVTGKGKGKAREASVPDRKGKGKAVTHIAPTLSSQGSEHDDSSQGSPCTAAPRYSLRPRHRAGDLPLSPSPDAAATSPRPTRPLPRRRGVATAASSSSATKVKGKGRARKPVIEEEYEWTCPVSGCGRAHRSVRMSGDDQWKMANNEGATALFV